MKPIYIVLLLLAAAFHVLYKGTLSFVLLVFLIALPVISGVMLLLEARRMRVTAECEETVTERGKGVSVIIRISNPTVLPIASCGIRVRYKTCFPFEKTVSDKHDIFLPVAPKGSETAAVRFKAEHCGAIDVSLEKVRVFDFLSLFSVRKKIALKEKIIVIPPACDFDADMETGVVSDSESSSFSQVKSGDDPSEIFRLREYRDGDRMNRIHWKLSSRSTGLIVKELSCPVSSKVLLAADFCGCKSAEDTDRVLDMLSALAAYCLKNGNACTAAAAYSGGMLRTWELSDSCGLCGALADMSEDICRLDFENRISESGADIFKEKFSRIAVAAATVNKAFADELSLLCGESGLTIFCTDKSPENTGGEPLSAEVVYMKDIS